MTQYFQDTLRILLYDLSDEVKMQLSELNQSNENITRGPDHKLFERGILLGYLQGQRQMIHAVEELISHSISDEVLINELSDIQQQLEQTLTSKAEQCADFNPTTHFKMESIYQSALELAHTYELRGKYYIVRKIGGKMNTLRSDNM